MRNRYVVLVFIIFLFSACGNSSKQKQTDTSVTVENPQTVSEAKFPFPEIPTMLTQPEERKAYLMAHYWENFNFADTALVNNRSAGACAEGVLADDGGLPV